MSPATLTEVELLMLTSLVTFAPTARVWPLAPVIGEAAVVEVAVPGAPPFMAMVSPELAMAHPKLKIWVMDCTMTLMRPLFWPWTVTFTSAFVLTTFCAISPVASADPLEACEAFFGWGVGV